MFFYNNVIKNTIEYSESAGYSLLSKEKEFELIEKAQNGCERSTEELILSNVKLVVSCMKGLKGTSMTKEDIFQEGLLGLYDAIDRFDTSKDCRFSTYATLVIKHRIVRSLSNKDRTVRLPVYVVENLGKIMKSYQKFEEKGILEPSIDDIVKDTGINKKNVLRALQNKDHIMSTDIEYEGKDGSCMTFEELYLPEELITEEVYEEVESNIIQDDLIGFLEDNLDKRSFKVIMSVYGLGELKDSKSYEELAEELDLSIERVRQIEKSAIKKLQSKKGVIENMFMS